MRANISRYSAREIPKKLIVSQIAMSVIRGLSRKDQRFQPTLAAVSQRVTRFKQERFAACEHEAPTPHAAPAGESYNFVVGSSREFDRSGRRHAGIRAAMRGVSSTPTHSHDPEAFNLVLAMWEQ